MNRITAFIAASALVASSAVAFAGGPVMIDKEPMVQPVVVETPSSGGLGGPGTALLVGLGVIVAAAVASSGGGSNGGGGNESGSH